MERRRFINRILGGLAAATAVAGVGLPRLMAKSETNTTPATPRLTSDGTLIVDHPIEVEGDVILGRVELQGGSLNIRGGSTVRIAELRKG